MADDEQGAELAVVGLDSTILDSTPVEPVNRSFSTEDGSAPTGPGGPRHRPRELQSGAEIGRYVVLSRIGHGGMGIVYEAHDPDLDRRVALKFLLAGERVGSEGSARLLREAQSLAQLSHPNVVAVHDVGMIGDRVWIAMEFLDGPNLAKWVHEKQRKWKDILPVFLQAGAGLQAAHAAGFVHRDFKPENVMFGRDGRVRVVDFGLARDAKPQGGDQTKESLTEALPVDHRLTMTGALLGTPRYMAKEQWNGAQADAKSDQFSFCVSLWEAVYGEPPFTGATIPELMLNVQQGRMKAVTSKANAPGWIKAALLRGLRTNPSERWPSMEALLVALQGTRIRRVQLLVLGSAIALVLAMAAIGRQRELAKIAEEIDAMVASSTEVMSNVDRELANAEVLRVESFAAFDAGKTKEGEELWSRYLEIAAGIEPGLTLAAQHLETALSLDTRRDDVRKRLLAVLWKRSLDTERGSRGALAVRDQIERMKFYDQDGEYLKRWDAPAELNVTSEPPGALVTLERYLSDGRHMQADSMGPLGDTPLTPQILGPGSYRLHFAMPGRVSVVYPVLLHRNDLVNISIDLPSANAVPEGFIYVPKGLSLYGSRDVEAVRQLLDSEPIHPVETGPYLIARNEVTYGEYIEFLGAQSAERRAEFLKAGVAGPARLEELADGRWRLMFSVVSEDYVAESGAPIVYKGRNQRASVAWERLPAAAWDVAEMAAYLDWLDRSGRVPGARFCNEHEWERAARGADERLYASGDELYPQDANFDATYGKVATAFGPDPVGSYPQTLSPFGLLDTDGNVYEVTQSPYDGGVTRARGGAYFYAKIQARTAVHFEVPKGLRDTTLGLRVCATWPSPAQRPTGEADPR